MNNQEKINYLHLKINSLNAVIGGARFEKGKTVKLEFSLNEAIKFEELLWEFVNYLEKENE